MNQFWKHKKLNELTKAEWESLCDGCAQCCLHKLVDADTKKVHITGVACRMLDISACRCVIYERRHILMSSCIELTPNSVAGCEWLPETCGYRRLLEGKNLEWWHPLISGSRETVHEAGFSIRDRAVSGRYVHLKDLEAYILHEDED